jgi:hypothetical protein
MMLLGSALTAGACMSAQAAAPTEYEVKAAFIYNIAKYVEWPAAVRTSGPLNLCILGRNPFGNALEALRGQPVGDKVWEVLPVQPNTNLSKCGVLFIAASESNNLGQILDDLKNTVVLTIGDTNGYAEQGVMVNFYSEHNRVRFEINNDAAGRAGLKISSQLLKLARIVAEPRGKQ